MKKFIFCQILAILFLKPSFSDSPKIDLKGRYISFPGITVIARPLSEDAKVLKSLYSKLAHHRLIKRYYSPLPADSYHMTTMNLFTEAKEGSENWSSFVEERLPWFQALHRQVSETPFVTQGKIVGPKFGNTLALVIDLPSEDKAKIMEFAEAHGLPKKVPPYFHITLGYSYRKIPKMVKVELQSAVNELVEDLVEKPIHFDSPQLTYFNDMTEFVPWNAKENPFAGSGSDSKEETKIKIEQPSKKARL